MIEYYEDAAGEIRWRLRGDNGEIVCHGEGHRDKHDAQRAVGRAAVSMMRAIAGDDWVPVSGTEVLNLDLTDVRSIAFKPFRATVTRLVKDDAGFVQLRPAGEIDTDTELVEYGLATRLLLIDEGTTT